MSERETFADGKIGQEEEYFRKKEQELIEKMRQRAALDAERRGLAEATGIADEAILEDLRALGYTRDTVEQLLHLVPLVQVAWAGGFVTSRESGRIFEVARLRGVEDGSPAHRQLTLWLGQRPSEEFFRNTLRIIRHLMLSLPAEDRTASRHDLVSYCTSVAAASGGILGLGRKISEKERAALEGIAKELERDHQDATREVIEKS